MTRGARVALWGCCLKEGPLTGERPRSRRKKKRGVENGSLGAEVEGGGRGAAVPQAIAGLAVLDPASRQRIFACPRPGGRTNFGGCPKSTPGSCCGAP